MSGSEDIPTGPRRAEDATRFVPWLRGRNQALARVPARVLESVLREARVARYQRDAVLLAQGSPGDRVFILVGGSLAIRVASNGIFRELHAYQVGEVAGLLALLDNGPSPYEVRAASDVEVVEIDAASLGQMVACYHPVGVAVIDAFLPMLSDHLHQLDDRAVRLAARKNAAVSGSGATIRRDDR